MLSTLLPPGGGEATVAGCNLRREPQQVRERIGYVGQRGGTDPAITGRTELVFQARLYGAAAVAAKKRAAELLAVLDLEACADRPCGSYSGGQRLRLDIGLGLVHRPPLLFLDEPTTGLDPQSRAHLWDEVRRLRDGGTTIFLTTHYLEEADALCNRLAIIDHGKIVAEGTPDELKRQIAGDVVTRDPGDRPEPVPDEHRDAADQDPVEAPDEGGDLGRLAPAGAGCCAGVGDVVIDHQSLGIGPVRVACLPKNDSKTLSAAGAAASPPWPPFSTSAQTTRSGESEGP